MEVKEINDKEYLHWLKIFYIGVAVHLLLNVLNHRLEEFFHLIYL